jgi:hypothetical protein
MQHDPAIIEAHARASASAALAKAISDGKSLVTRATAALRSLRAAG